MATPRLTLEELGNALVKIDFDPTTGRNRDLGEALGLLPYWGRDSKARSRADERPRVELRTPEIVEGDERRPARGILFNGFNRGNKR